MARRLRWITPAGVLAVTAAFVAGIAFRYPTGWDLNPNTATFLSGIFGAVATVSGVLIGISRQTRITSAKEEIRQLELIRLYGQKTMTICPTMQTFFERLQFGPEVALDAGDVLRSRIKETLQGLEKLHMQSFAFDQQRAMDAILFDSFLEVMLSEVDRIRDAAELRMEGFEAARYYVEAVSALRSTYEDYVRTLVERVDAEPWADHMKLPQYSIA